MFDASTNLIPFHSAGAFMATSVKVAHMRIMRPGQRRKYRAEGSLIGSSRSRDL
jgi:hypothetical protein